MGCGRWMERFALEEGDEAGDGHFVEIFNFSRRE